MKSDLQDYFEWGKKSREVDRLILEATDGPNIIQIAK